MKKWIKTVVFSLAVILAIPVTAPQCNQTIVEAATKVTINYTKKTIYEGDSFKLKITGTTKKIKWSSSNKKVATVSSKGVVKGIYGGTSKKTCKITAIVGGNKYVCKVTVKPVEKEDDYDDNYEEEKYIPSNHSSTENITYLKNYIEKYGYINKFGENVIENVYKETASHIIYQPKSNSLLFLFKADTLPQHYVEMTIYSNDNSENLEVKHTCISNDYAFITNTFIDPTKYNDTYSHFSFVENGSMLSENQIQNISNSAMRLAFAGWKMCLYDNLQMSMSDLGFYLYR